MPQLIQSTCHKSTLVNNPKLIDLIRNIKPDLIIVNGTRIISAQIIKQIPQNMYNLHVGITPKYRGVHGGYWALVNGEPEHFGITLHQVDSGIDSGNVIAQKTGKISSKDHFLTYPVIQYCLGLDLLDEHIETLVQTPTPLPPLTNDSRLFYHPTIWTYLKHRWFSGIK